MDCPEYFRSVEERISAEQERATSYLEPLSSLPKLLQLLIEVFVTNQVRCFAQRIAWPLFSVRFVCGHLAWVNHGPVPGTFWGTSLPFVGSHPQQTMSADQCLSQ
jgi:hypothetical protein